MISMNDRFERQRDLVPQDRLAGLTATIIGVGAIGRQIALQLAAIGVPRLQLIDFDRVETTNVTTQGYWASDVGQLKVAATRNAVQAIEPTILVETCADRFRSKHSVGDALFCAVDSISARTSIWRALEHRCRFWADGRMLGETIRVLSVAEGNGCEHYASTLFPQSEAQSGRCTSRSTVYAAAIAAGVMVHQFTRWLRDLPTDVDTTMDLLATEWAATSTHSDGSSRVRPANAFIPPAQGNAWEHVKS
jgi:sulfur carrier protein ThiS adenylyltransferase